VTTDGDAGLVAAAARGPVAAVRALHQGGVDLARSGSAALIAAAGGGRLDVVAYLHENGVALDEGALDAAAAGGHLEVVRYLHTRGVDVRARNGEALCRAAAAGRRDVVVYLHRNGAQHLVLSEESRARVRAMEAEIAAAPEIYRPSLFWEDLSRHHLTLLGWGGEDNFKRTVNQSYFNAVPASLLDPLVRGLARAWLRAPSLGPMAVEIDDPDCDPRLWSSWCDGHFIFRGRRRRWRYLYKLLVGALWEHGLRTDRHGVLARMEEPELGNPIRIRRAGRRISQDLVHSVRERNAIVDALAAGPAPADAPAPAAAGRPRIAELGAGYGRLGHVLLATTGCRYLVFDLPPALHVSQWYLSRLFPERRIFPFRPFRAFAEIAAELALADVAFFTANQLALFPDRYFDAFVTISSLHEMRLDQIRHFLALMARTTRDVLYVKQYRCYENPLDRLRVTPADYALPAGWAVATRRVDPLDSRFFELVARCGGAERRG
jgi:putative sugar O-methyltransferase